MYFEGKRGLVLGVANKRSIAWAIADGSPRAALGWHSPTRGERIRPTSASSAKTVSSPLVTSCDVRSDKDIARVFSEVSDAFGGELDILVHSVAFAAAEDLEGRFTDTPRERFSIAPSTSAPTPSSRRPTLQPLMDATAKVSVVTITSRR